jgi:small-conductance mechanosensitive channel
VSPVHTTPLYMSVINATCLWTTSPVYSPGAPSAEIRRLQMLLSGSRQREQSIKRREAELAEREASLQGETSEMHAMESGLELREKRLHRAEQNMQLLMRQHKDAVELLDRLTAIGKL